MSAEEDHAADLAAAQRHPENGSGRAEGRPRAKRSPPRDEILLSVSALDRTLFANILADFYLAAPGRQHIERFGRKSPDRYMQALTMAAKLSGYRDQVDVRSAVVDLRGLSDAELLQRAEAARLELDAYQAQLGARPLALDADTPTQGPENADDAA